MMHVRWIGCVAVLLLAGLGGAPRAQSTADAYFHEAARQYVADDVQAARQAVERGLEVAPSDPRLVALREKLNQGSRPDDRRGGRDSTSSSGEQGKQQNDNSSGEDTSQDGTEAAGERGKSARTEDQEDPPSTTAGPRSSAQRPANRAGRADTMRQGRGGRPVDTLSRAQAERLLRALEGQERRLLRQLRTRSSKSRSVEKDW